MGARARSPSLRFERVDVLEDGPFVEQLVAQLVARAAGPPARRAEAGPPAAAAPAGGGARGALAPPPPLVAFVDLGGVRELGALARALPWAVELGAAVVVVKSTRLSALFAARAAPGGAGAPLAAREFWPRCSRARGARARAAAVAAAAATAQHRARAPGAGGAYRRPVRYAGGREVCRFHNYARGGCLRGRRGRRARPRPCRDGARGHVALACARAPARARPRGGVATEAAAAEAEAGALREGAGRARAANGDPGAGCACRDA